MSPPKTHSSASTPPAVSMASSLSGDASPSDPQVLRILYSVLLKTRLLQEEVLSHLKAGRRLRGAAPILGGEATEVGACIGLQPGDSFSSTRLTLATAVVLGTPLEQLFAKLFQSSSENPDPDANPISFRTLPQASSITGQLDVATGVALAYRNLGKANVVVVIADDALAALGFWHEAATLASRNRLPVIFMVENREPLHSNGKVLVRSNEDLRDRAEAYGIPGVTLEGNDVVAVWRVTQESIHRARTGAGPTLIECRTWRWHADTHSLNGHTPPKPPNGWQKDPLLHMELYMKKRSFWSLRWKQELAAEYREHLSAATRSALALP